MLDLAFGRDSCLRSHVSGVAHGLHHSHARRVKMYVADCLLQAQLHCLGWLRKLCIENPPDIVLSRLAWDETSEVLTLCLPTSWVHGAAALHLAHHGCAGAADRWLAARGQAASRHRLDLDCAASCGEDPFGRRALPQPIPQLRGEAHHDGEAAAVPAGKVRDGLPRDRRRPCKHGSRCTCSTRPLRHKALGPGGRSKLTWCAVYISSS
jgi:hypothetical protein